MSHRPDRALLRELLSGPLGGILGFALGASVLIVFGSVLGRGIDLGTGATDVVSVPRAAQQDTGQAGGGVTGALSAALRTRSGGRAAQADADDATPDAVSLESRVDAADEAILEGLLADVDPDLEPSQDAEPVFAVIPTATAPAAALDVELAWSNEDTDEDEDVFVEPGSTEARFIAEPADPPAAENDPAPQLAAAAEQPNDPPSTRAPVATPVPRAQPVAQPQAPAAAPRGPVGSATPKPTATRRPIRATPVPTAKLTAGRRALDFSGLLTRASG